MALGSSKSRGIAILIANSLRFECTKVEADPSDRYIFVKGLLDVQLYTIGSIYAPNIVQLTFLEDTLMKLSQFQEGHTIVGGDFNYVANMFYDRFVSSQVTQQHKKGENSLNAWAL